MKKLLWSLRETIMAKRKDTKNDAQEASHLDQDASEHDWEGEDTTDESSEATGGTKKRKFNKSEVARNFIHEHPEMGPSEVSKKLEETFPGQKFPSSMISNVKQKMKGGSEKRGKKDVGFKEKIRAMVDVMGEADFLKWVRS
jgi:hypothetical protein